MKKAIITCKDVYTSVLSVALVWLVNQSSFGQCTTANTLTVPAQYTTPALVGNGNFNAIVFGNLTATSGDTEGRLAVGGNFTYNPAIAGDGYSVGLAGPGTGGQDAPAQTDNFIVNGNFTNSSGIAWRVRGNFIYTANTPGSTLPTHATGEGTSTQTVANSRINFAPLKNYYIGLSNGLTTQTPVGTSSVNAQNELTLTGDGRAHHYVFTLTLPNGTISGLNFVNIPVAGSTILINVLNTSLSITGGAISNTAYRTQTLFNFPNAASVNVTNFLLEGAILAPNANVVGSAGGINGQSVIGGNLSQVGGFEFHNFCLNQNNPLPVRLSSFTVIKDEQVARLSWTTDNEQNNRGFAIEHSLDAKSWKQLTFVGGLGTSMESHAYTYRHNQPGPGTNYYRLGQVDYDGQTTYSSIRALSFEATMAIYPNPVTEKVYLNLPQSSQYPYKVTLFDGLGRSVLALPSRTYAAGVELDVHHLTEGVYLLHLVREGNVSIKRLVVKH